MGIPALDRGLDILDTLISRNSPLRYSDIKRTLPGISDSSLNRLLLSLIDKDFISKDSNGRYIPSSNLVRWGKLLIGQQSLEDEIKVCIESIVSKTGESAAFARFDGEKITITASISAKDSISIIPKGDLLHFESDHGGALAILETMSDDEKLSCISSTFSKIDSINDLAAGLKIFRKTQGSTVYFLDESVSRKGVCRLAIPLCIDNSPCAMFICAPTIRIKENLDSCISALIHHADCIN